MAADSPANSSTGLPKWQIALAVGAPIAVGVAVGAYYYRKSRSKDADTDEEKSVTQGNTSKSTANSEPKKEEKVRNLEDLQVLTT